VIARPMLARWLRAVTCAILVSACSRDVTAPRVLRLVPSIRPEALIGIFTTGTITSNGQQAAVGQQVLITVKAIDQDSIPVPNVRVSWNIVDGGGSTSAAAVMTDSIGNATVGWTLDTIVKLDSIRASIPQGATVVMWATGRPAAVANIVKVSGDSLSVAAGGDTLPLAVRITDRYGNPNKGVTIAWLATNGATLNTIENRTDANGVANVVLTSGSAPGTYHVIGTFGSIPAVVFTVIAK
jgi:hypothetical protein